jgi:hypothetical protein
MASRNTILKVSSMKFRQLVQKLLVVTYAQTDLWVLR